MKNFEEAIIIVKAAPVIGEKHGETVCCAGLTRHGQWLRLYPVSFRVLEETKKFSRWDIVRFESRSPTSDIRQESRHVNHQTLEIVSKLKSSERSRFLAQKVVTSLNKEHEEGRTLALLEPKNVDFLVERKSDSEVREEQSRVDAFHAQTDMFLPRPAVPKKACPYRFKYRYKTDDGPRLGTCQDWETEWTFFKWRKIYGELGALERMKAKFGHEMPKTGLYFAMGTHSMHPGTWLINGLIQVKMDDQRSLL